MAWPVARIGGVGQPLPAPEYHTADHPDHDAQDEADQRFLQRLPGVDPQRAVAGQHPHARGHRDRAADPLPAAPRDRQHLPEHQRDEDGDRAVHHEPRADPARAREAPRLEGLARLGAGEAGAAAPAATGSGPAALPEHALHLPPQDLPDPPLEVPEARLEARAVVAGAGGGRSGSRRRSAPGRRSSPAPGRPWRWPRRCRESRSGRSGPGSPAPGGNGCPRGSGSGRPAPRRARRAGTR